MRLQDEKYYLKRIAALRHDMHRQKLDVFISSFIPTVRYLCGYSGSNGLLIVTGRSTFFLTDFRYQEIIRTEVCAGKKIIGSGSLIQLAADNNLFTGAATIGFEKEYVTVADREIIRSFIGTKKLKAVAGIVECLRSVKDGSELTSLKKAFKISDSVFQKILDVIKPGMTERDLSAEISYYHKKFGAENDSFDVIVASGVRGSLPHGTASDKKLRSKEFVTLDFGCIVEGYHSDMTRTICIGAPTAEMKKVYSTVLEALQKASGAVQAGISAKSIDSIAREHIASKGYGKYFGHSLGHGVGLEIHELPRVSIKSNAILKAGNVITIEPGIYLPKKFGVRIEDTIVIKENGIEVLTQSPKELIIL